MSFFITVSLTHKTIAIKYYRENDNVERLIPVKGISCPAPLAIYINDNDVAVGDQALRFYEQKLSGAFFNIFSLLKNEQVFTYYSETRDARQALYVGLENVINDFIASTPGLPYGNIDEAREQIPVAFEFYPEITADERTYVIDLFTKGHKGYCGGYGNIGTYDSNRYLADELLKNDYRNQVLVLSSDGVDLSMSLYCRSTIQTECIAHATEPDKGADPRINKLIDALLEQIMLQNSFIDRTMLLPQLRDIAIGFIADQRYELQGQVVVNNYSYDYFITRGDGNVNSSIAGSAMVNRIKNFTAKAGIDINDTIVALRGPEIQNEYFISNFRNNFEKVTVVDDNTIENIQRYLISDIVSKNYILDNNRLKEDRHEENIKREFAELATVIRNVYIPDCRFNDAKTELFEFRDIANKTGIHDLDNAITTLISQINEAEACRKNESKPVRNQETASGPLPPAPAPGYEQMVEMLEREVPILIADDRREEAFIQVKGLELDLKGDRISTYNDRIQALLDLIKGRRSKTAAEPARKTPSDPLEEAIFNRDFRKAKNIYNDNEDYDNAVKMGQLANLHHKYEVASRRVDDYKAEGNAKGIQRCISELTEYIGLLDEIGLDHTDVDRLLNKFKN